MAKLNPAQLRALAKLAKAADWQCAYDVQESLATLDALVSRGYAQRVREEGWLFIPRVQIKYRISTEGIAKLSEEGG